MTATDPSLSDFYAGPLQRRDGWAANDYGSARSQHKRFRVATEALGIRNGDRVNDIGCGTGEYSKWLHDNGHDVDWRGFDVLPEMVLEVQKRHNRRASVLNAFEAVPPKAEWSVAIGLLGVLDMPEESNRWSATRRLLANLWESSIHGFAVSTQTSRTGRTDPDGRRWFVDPAHLFHQVLELFPDAQVAVRADYHPFDVMYVVRHWGF